jgi:pyridoxine 5-phosphate synthase
MGEVWTNQEGFMAYLNVNIDHIATVRQARGEAEPDPVAAAMLAELAGAHGITVHLREDRRHIQYRDVRLLRNTVRTLLNLEMAATPTMIDAALRVRPDQVTLVPERRQELTTEGGLKVKGAGASLRAAIRRLQSKGIPVSLFIDPTLESVEASHDLGAAMVELHTGAYSHAFGPHGPGRDSYEALDKAAHKAAKLGMSVHAGHGLNYRNVVPVASIPEIEDLNIGHNIIARACLVGMDRAVRDMIALLDSAGCGCDCDGE